MSRIQALCHVAAVVKTRKLNSNCWNKLNFLCWVFDAIPARVKRTEAGGEEEDKGEIDGVNKGWRRSP